MYHHFKEKGYPHITHKEKYQQNKYLILTSHKDSCTERIFFSKLSVRFKYTALQLRGTLTRTSCFPLTKTEKATQ